MAAAAFRGSEQNYTLTAEQSDLSQEVGSVTGSGFWDRKWVLGQEVGSVTGNPERRSLDGDGEVSRGALGASDHEHAHALVAEDFLCGAAAGVLLEPPESDRKRGRWACRRGDVTRGSSASLQLQPVSPPFSPGQAHRRTLSGSHGDDDGPGLFGGSFL
ncbi:hypothetical protein EYF80_036957 [Liparis tanakae]|uniref:Uncharacterized protein n=1 Tax=Liparis tanakae TaxID=230148 RepID=A0A4Z2GH39_9TELE|nr:hypothetical protein EYF80_036957 [Liparis tanakae]